MRDPRVLVLHLHYLRSAIIILAPTMRSSRFPIKLPPLLFFSPHFFCTRVSRSASNFSPTLFLTQLASLSLTYHLLVRYLSQSLFCSSFSFRPCFYSSICFPALLIFSSSPRGHTSLPLDKLIYLSGEPPAPATFRFVSFCCSCFSPIL